MILEILSPEKLIFKGEADLVQLPGKNGSFQVLKDHARIIATLQKGAVRMVFGSNEQNFEVNGGVVEVVNNRVIVLSE